TIFHFNDQNFGPFFFHFLYFIITSGLQPHWLYFFGIRKRQSVECYAMTSLILPDSWLPDCQYFSSDEGIDDGAEFIAILWYLLLTACKSCCKICLTLSLLMFRINHFHLNT
ncbi:hypothetical protein L9F63_010931, partial [Diploptera punctata]